MARDPKPGELAAFAGLNTVLPPERLKPTDLAQAVNVDIDDSGAIARRQGFSQVLNMPVSAFWADGTTALLVSAGTLYQYLGGNQTLALRTGLPDAPLSAVTLGARVYFACGGVMGVVEDGRARSWGIPAPSLAVDASPMAGSLAPGRYLLSLSYVRSDGQESGHSRVSVAELPQGGGLQLRLPVSADADVSHKRLYCSTADGETRYRVTLLDNAATTTALTALPGLVVAARDEDVLPAPAGSQVGLYNGRLFVLASDLLWYSEPYAVEHFNPTSYLPFGAELTLFAPLPDGVILASRTETLFAQGDNPRAWRRVPMASQGEIPGTAVATDATALGLEGLTGPAWLWQSPDGVCVGAAGGYYQNLTHTRVQWPDLNQGAGLLRQQDGLSQYLGAGQVSQSQVGDSLTVSVRRNGVILQE